MLQSPRLGKITPFTRRDGWAMASVVLSSAFPLALLVTFGVLATGQDVGARGAVTLGIVYLAILPVELGALFAGLRALARLRGARGITWRPLAFLGVAISGLSILSILLTAIGLFG